MTLVRDLSLNGQGAVINNRGTGQLLNLGSGDVILKEGDRIRVGGAGNLILRYPKDSADITIAASAGEYVPVFPGTIIRSTSTATVLQPIASS